jgi:hypothetical protein
LLYDYFINNQILIIFKAPIYWSEAYIVEPDALDGWEGEPSLPPGLVVSSVPSDLKSMDFPTIGSGEVNMNDIEYPSSPGNDDSSPRFVCDIGSEISTQQGSSVRFQKKQPISSSQISGKAVCIIKI